MIFTGILADFDTDGLSDYLCVTFDGLVLIPGTGQGLAFNQEARSVWTPAERLAYAQTLTAVDIDLDGDLDLFLGQYKTPYERGQMPTPYYDARDGHADYLLINDGYGNFQDETEKRGLGSNRLRRTLPIWKDSIWKWQTLLRR